MIRCNKCKRSLPESEFYESQLRQHKYVCKKCLCDEHKYKRIQKKAQEKTPIVQGVFAYLNGTKHTFTVQTSDSVFTTSNEQEFWKNLSDKLSALS